MPVSFSKFSFFYLLSLLYLIDMQIYNTVIPRDITCGDIMTGFVSCNEASSCVSFSIAPHTSKLGGGGVAGSFEDLS
jgi:hypothetical protein